MIRKLLWLLLLLGYVAMVWHGVTGDTGPMGWLNALQQQWTGGYSRKLSFLVFCFGTIALSSPLLALILISPTEPAAAAAPADAHPAPVTAPDAKPTSGWKTAALAWFVPVSLAWVGVSGYYAWEWHVRGQDAAQRYVPVSLAQGAPVAPVAAGSHLALQARFLWDRTVVRRERGKPEATYVPLVDRAWREGESVRFIAYFDSRDVPAWREGANTPRSDILARVQGSVPTAAFDVFAKAGAPLGASASLIVAVASADGQPAQKVAAFDIQSALVVATVLTAVWTVCVLAIALGLAREKWAARRRARRASLGIKDDPSNFKWIGAHFHRK